MDQGTQSQAAGPQILSGKERGAADDHQGARALCRLPGFSPFCSTLTGFYSAALARAGELLCKYPGDISTRRKTPRHLEVVCPL